MRWKRPLYLMAKPPAEKLPELARLRAWLGIESGYALDRLHSTLLPLGESTPGTIDAARAILGSFHAEPFEIVFDHVEGVTLKPRKGQRAPGVFQRALARHVAVSGLSRPTMTAAGIASASLGPARSAALRSRPWAGRSPTSR